MYKCTNKAQYLFLTFDEPKILTMVDSEEILSAKVLFILYCITMFWGGWGKQSQISTLESMFSCPYHK